MELFAWVFVFSLVAWGAFAIHKVVTSSEGSGLPGNDHQRRLDTQKLGLESPRASELAATTTKARTPWMGTVIEVVPSKGVDHKKAGKPIDRKPETARPVPARNGRQAGSFEFDIVGESHRQAALESIAGPKESTGKEFECTAVVSRERNNKHDPNALVVTIDKKKVGYISRQDNKRLIAELGDDGFPLTVPAVIIGGWRSAGSEGSYGVRLALPSNSPPASAHDKAMVRYVEGKLPRGLTERQVKNRLKHWKKDSNDRFDQWEALEEIVEHLQSADGRLEFGIKKPSTDAIIAAFDELIDEGLDVDDFSADEVVDKLLITDPALAR